MNIKTLSIRNVLAVAVVGLLFGITYFTNPSFLKAPKAEADAGQNVSGYAWSENIGWVSFNSTNEASGASYGVNVDMANKATGGAGDFSGTAWSRGAGLDGGVGWISFNRTDTGTPPAAPFDGVSGPIAQVDWSTGNVTGWARALSACDPNCATNPGAGPNSGGWDGWIKLSDASWTNGVKIAGNKFSGYAWGGGDGPGIAGVVGWIDFAPTVGGISVGAQISAPPCTIATATSWGTCQALTQCTAPPATQSVMGIKIGLCAGGGTVTDTCGPFTQTCTSTAAPATGVKQKFQQF